MSGSDTVRVDKRIRELEGCGDHWYKLVEITTLARQLERELNAANNRITELEQELRAAYERT